MEISKDGSFIVMCVNGTFQGKGITYGLPPSLWFRSPRKNGRSDQKKYNRDQLRRLFTRSTADAASAA